MIGVTPPLIPAGEQHPQVCIRVVEPLQLGLGDTFHDTRGEGIAPDRRLLWRVDGLHSLTRAHQPKGQVERYKRVFGVGEQDALEVVV